MMVSTYLDNDKRPFVFSLDRVVCAWAINPTVKPKSGGPVTAVMLDGDKEVRVIDIPWQAFVRLMD